MRNLLPSTLKPKSLNKAARMKKRVVWRQIKKVTRRKGGRLSMRRNKQKMTQRLKMKKIVKKNLKKRQYQMKMKTIMMKNTPSRMKTKRSKKMMKKTLKMIEHHRKIIKMRKRTTHQKKQLPLMPTQIRMESLRTKGIMVMRLQTRMTTTIISNRM